MVLRLPNNNAPTSAGTPQKTRTFPPACAGNSAGRPQAVLFFARVHDLFCSDAGALAAHERKKNLLLLSRG
jgi:hypothetical protein